MTNQTDPYGRHEFVLVVDPKAELRVRDGKVQSIADVDVEPLTRVLSEAKALIRPLYGTNEEWLKHRTAFTKTLMGHNQSLDLSIFYKITAPSSEEKALLAQLRELPIVQAAYLKPRADLPFVDLCEEDVEETFTFSRMSDDFSVFQEYLLPAADGGIDARYAWGITGGGGQGIKMIDIEGAWRFSHEDLVENPSGCIGGVPISSPRWRKHGTAVLGMLAADHNQFGVQGICPDADVRTVSIFANANGDDSPDWGSAAAIRFAADMLGAGDIMLIELHRPGPAANFQENEQTQEGYIPVEWWPCDMAAILYATHRGILVVEAGGNGQQDLDDCIYDINPATPNGPFPPWWINPFRRDTIDTKAILVGAGAPPPGTHNATIGPDRSKIGLSNFGAPIDTQGWGIEVATCGFNGDLTPGVTEDRRYTRRFNGTSSASAMIAGAVCCLQGILKTKGKFLSPLEARVLLRDNELGLAQQDGPLGPANLQRIGPRPDLKKLIDLF